MVSQGKIKVKKLSLGLYSLGDYGSSEGDSLDTPERKKQSIQPWASKKINESKNEDEPEEIQGSSSVSSKEYTQASKDIKKEQDSSTRNNLLSASTSKDGQK